MKKEDTIMKVFRLSIGDVNALNEVAEQLQMSHTDVIKIALWQYIANEPNGILKVSLRELANLKVNDMQMDVFKEIERINNRMSFFIDGFRTMLDTYFSKHAPLSNVKRYVTIKLVALYSLNWNSRERSDFVRYVKTHFVHYYPHERKWIESQLRMIKSLKKDSKDKLLERLKRDGSRCLPEMRESERGVSMRRYKPMEVPEAFAKRAKAKDIEASGKE